MYIIHILLTQNSVLISAIFVHSYFTYRIGSRMEKGVNPIWFGHIFFL